jgi:hypothetical protein
MMNKINKGLVAGAVALWVAQAGFAGSAAAEENKSLTAVLEAEIVTLDPHFRLHHANLRVHGV